MNRSTILRTAIAGGVAAAGLSVGGIALATASSPSEEPAPTVAFAHDGPGDRGGAGFQLRFGGEDLAEALGVSQERLRDAMEAVRDEVRPTERPAGPPGEAGMEALQDRLAAALAKELDLTQAKVEAALEEVRSAHEAQRRTHLSDRLDEAVEDGDLTAGDKASVLKAFDAGVLGGPRLR